MLGGLLVDAVGIRPLFWAGGTLLALADVLGLALLGGYDFHADEAGDGTPGRVSGRSG